MLLDTNVVSELRKISNGMADANVVAWATKRDVATTFVSAITIFEIERGILRLERRDTKQAAMLRQWLNADVVPAFENRILPVDTFVALRCAALHVPDPRPERDAMIAATALVHGLTFATRNVADFRPMLTDIVDPWREDAASGRSS